ncbi:unnamed protein product, partial [Clonostachys rhizophaga]
DCQQYISHGMLSFLLEKWDNYSIVLALRGFTYVAPYVIETSLDTIPILPKTDHFRLKHDAVYSTSDFDTLLSQRPGVTKEMEEYFSQLMSLVRNQVTLQTGHKEKTIEMPYSLGVDAARSFAEDVALSDFT